MPIDANIADARNTNAISNVDVGTFQWYSSLSIMANQHKANSTTYITEIGKRLYGLASIKSFQNFADENIRVISSYDIFFDIVICRP